MTGPYVFISYSRPDRAFVARLAESLRAAGVQTWTDVENIVAGAKWQKEIEKGLMDALVLIYVASENSVSSHWMEAELQRFLEKQRRVIPIVIDDHGANNLPISLLPFQWADFRGDYDVAFQRLLKGIGFLQKPEPIKHPELKSKGYVFVSYAEEDSSFVEELSAFLAKHGYAYWDFRESERDYDLDYSIELERVIKDAAGTLSVISPSWKRSKISLREFHFSEEAGTPVFLLKVRDPGPTLALSGLTFIDFTRDHADGFAKLDRELRRKGL
jgi:TIR domain